MWCSICLKGNHSDTISFWFHHHNSETKCVSVYTSLYTDIFIAGIFQSKREKIVSCSNAVTLHSNCSRQYFKLAHHSSYKQHFKISYFLAVLQLVFERACVCLAAAETQTKHFSSLFVVAFPSCKHKYNPAGDGSGTWMRTLVFHLLETLNEFGDLVMVALVPWIPYINGKVIFELLCFTAGQTFNTGLRPLAQVQEGWWTDRVEIQPQFVLWCLKEYMRISTWRERMFDEYFINWVNYQLELRQWNDSLWRRDWTVWPLSRVSNKRSKIYGVNTQKFCGFGGGNSRRLLVKFCFDAGKKWNCSMR